MKVLLRKTISKLGHVGEIVEVKRGYARNYLLPQGLAVEPSTANLRAIEIEKQRYLEELAKQRDELQAKADLVQGKEITIFARANPEGHLYGSVGPAQLVAALAAENVFLEPEYLVLDPPIRQLDKYDVAVRFSEEITATIHVSIVPIREDDEQSDEPASEEAADEATEEVTEAPSDEVTEQATEAASEETEETEKTEKAQEKD